MADCGKAPWASTCSGNSHVCLFAACVFCECGVPSAVLGSEKSPFEELPSLFSRKQWLCDHRDLSESLPHSLDTLIPHTRAAFLQTLQLSPAMAHGTTRTVKRWPNTHVETTLCKKSWLSSSDWGHLNKWQGEFYTDRSNREPWVQIPLPQRLKQLQAQPWCLHR